MLVISLLLLSLTLLLVSAKRTRQLDLCSANGDTFGTWNDTNSLDIHAAKSHFVDGHLGAAIHYNQIWLPQNCSYHRFTKESVNAFASHILANSTTKSGRVHLIFMGDSALRGIFCGIASMLNGTELLGPNTNYICGFNANHHPVSWFQTNQLFDLDVGPYLRLSFIYVFNMIEQKNLWTIEYQISQSPFAFILNTGAWDFYHTNEERKSRGVNATTECDCPEDFKVEAVRTGDQVKAMLMETGPLAKRLGVKAIYRSNHINRNFGAYCADRKLIDILHLAEWNVWDNTRISQDVWREQTWDGFHFDNKAHTEEEHRAAIVAARAMGLPSPGMMQMQFANSLLFFVFRDTIQEFISKGIEIPV